MALFAAAYTSELKGLREPQLSDQWRAPNSLAICVVSKVSGNFVSGVHIDWFDSLDNYWRTGPQSPRWAARVRFNPLRGVGTLYGRRRNDSLDRDVDLLGAHRKVFRSPGLVPGPAHWHVLRRIDLRDLSMDDRPNQVGHFTRNSQQCTIKRPLQP